MARAAEASAYALRSLRLLLEAYAGAELPEWEVLGRSLRSVRLAPGESLFRAGERHPHVYYVESGLLKAEMTTPQGRAIIAFFSEEGEIVASMAALAPEGVRHVAERNLHPRVEELRPAVDGTSIHTLVAIEPSLLHRFDYPLLDRLATRHVAWARMSNAVSMMYAITLQADAATLRTTAEQRYRTLLESRPDLVERISRKDLAGYLGVTDVALSRIARRVATPPPAS